MNGNIPRRNVIRGIGALGTLAVVPTAVSANQGWRGGVGYPPDPDEETGNRLRPRAEPVALQPGDVEEVHVADPDPGQAEVYWVVRHGVEFDRALWREPAVFGNFNVNLGGSDSGSFWFGILGPGLEYRHHEGQLILYMLTDAGVWKSLTAQFTSQNRDELLHVNGIEPV